MTSPQQTNMTHPAMTISSQEPLFRNSKSEAMMEIIREDLSRQKPSKWGIVRRKYDHMFSRDAIAMRGSPDFHSVSKPVSRDSHLRIKLDSEEDVYGHRRQNIANVLRMMGQPDISPRYVPKGSITSRRPGDRLPTRGSRFSLDPQMLSATVQRRESMAFLPPIARRNSSIRSKHLPKRRSSVKQVIAPHVDQTEKETPNVTESKAISPNHACDKKVKVRNKLCSL